MHKGALLDEEQCDRALHHAARGTPVGDCVLIAVDAETG
jgi:hypothetical protein